MEMLIYENEIFHLKKPDSLSGVSSLSKTGFSTFGFGI
jgi:hypothetical protein